MKLIRDTVAIVTVINMCYTASATIMTFPDRAEGDNIRDAKRHVLYLTQILDKLGELTRLQNTDVIPDEQLATDYRDLGTLLEIVRPSLDNFVPDPQLGGNHDFNTYAERQETDDIPYSETSDDTDSFSNIEKKNYAILPPSNEWCRMMGFRRCRRYRS